MEGPTAERAVLLGDADPVESLDVLDDGVFAIEPIDDRHPSDLFEDHFVGSHVFAEAAISRWLHIFHSPCGEDRDGRLVATLQRGQVTQCPQITCQKEISHGSTCL